MPCQRERGREVEQSLGTRTATGTPVKADEVGMVGVHVC